MKAIKQRIFLSLTAVLSMANLGICQSLTVNNPLSWGSSPATIEEASLTIRPQGVFMEYGLYLTISAKGSSYFGRSTPALEIELDFCLPDRAIIHDSWLWVEDDIMQAILVDRQIATQIYEGIVNRRKDPSILYKNTDGCYELKIYPLSGNGSRKVKITYLIPTRWTNNFVSAPLPVDILKLSNTVPNLDLNIHTDNTFKDPLINELGFLPFGTYAGNGVYESTISASMFNDYTSMEISYASPLQDGLFSAEYPSGSDAGYYQLVFHQKHALGIKMISKR